MTRPERVMWTHLRAHRLSGLHFRRQQVIDGFIVNFFCAQARLVIEVDGKVHNRQLEYDRRRDGILSRRGLRVLRFTNRQVMGDLTRVLDAIRRTVYPMR